LKRLRSADQTVNRADDVADQLERVKPFAAYASAALLGR
jgi:hypothetical protein